MPDSFTVLIVDDEPFNVEYLRQELEEYGFTFLTAENGQKAVEKFAAFKPDLVLLDMMMPIMDGFEVLEKLKAPINSRESEVIIISALDDLSSIGRGLQMGAEDYLSKPFDPVILHARIKSILEKHKLRQIEKKYLKGLEREMEIGREIQADFLPPEIPHPEGWDIAVRFYPARNVAGDYYDVFQLSENLLAVISGDVCDKGIGAALYMSLYRSLIRAFTASAFSRLKDKGLPAQQTAQAVISAALDETNAYICSTHEEALFSSLFLGLLQTQTGELYFANAGHEPPLLLLSAEDRRKLPVTGPVVGFDLSAHYAIHMERLSPGDYMLIFSDGVPDAQDAGGNYFRDTAYLEQIAQPVGSAGKVLDDLMEALGQFTGGELQFDDITAIAVGRCA